MVGETRTLKKETQKEGEVKKRKKTKKKTTKKVLRIHFIGTLEASLSSQTSQNVMFGVSIISLEFWLGRM